MKRFLLLILCCFAGIVTARAQALQVNGVVKDESGAPVIGATVIVKGTQTGVISGADGAFRINAPSVESVLEISFIGYETAEVPVASNVQVTLRSTATAIDEVVVTGMTSMDRRLFTGATDRLAADDIRLDGVPDISRALEGRSAGVSVQNVSATFGTAPKIRIRGATSIFGNSKPLWVVDGVIIEDVTEVNTSQLSSGDAVTMISSAVAGLNADDIESFQILKDGSATSVYGAKAMAGVIVITTKRGSAGVTRINYTGEFTTRLKPQYSEYNIMNSQDQMGIYQELKSKGFLNMSETLRASKSGVYGRMYALNNLYDESAGQFGLPNTVKAQNEYLRQAEYRNTDWFDLLFSNAVQMNHSVSISSGTEKSTSYMSLSFMSDPGWYERSKVSRYTINANQSYKIYKNLTLNLLGNVSYRKQQAPGTLSQDVNAVSGEVKRDFDINPFSYAMNTSRTLDPDENYIRNYTSFNILDELRYNYMDIDVVDTRFQAELKYTIIPGLEFSSLAAAKYSTTSMQHHIKDESNQARAYREMSDATIQEKNPWLYDDPDQLNTLPVTILDEGGIYEKREYKMFSYDLRNSLTWNKNFDNTHIVYLYGAVEVNSTNRTNDWFQGWGLQYNQGEIPFYNYLAFKKMSEANEDYFTLANTYRRSAAFIFNGNYSFEGKYTLSGTVRYEGTNRLGKSRSARWLPTWNIGAAWNVHEEDFFKHITPAVSHLNIKASYSLTADAGPDHVSNSTAIINSYIPWRQIAGARESGLTISYLGNDDLTYEKKNEFNVGFSVGFLRNRLNLEADFYTRKNYDLIGLTNTQGVGGEIKKYANIADMNSKGVELTLSTRNVQTRDFNWNTDFTFSWNKNKITKLQSDAQIMDLIVGTGYSMEGYSPYSLFSIQYNELDSDGFPILQIGENIYTKENYSSINLQSTAAEDIEGLVYEGPTDPRITGGFGNVFSFKGFRLNVFMTYGFGNKIRLNPIFSYKYYDLDATPNEFKNRWMVPGDEVYTDIPVIASARQLQLYGENYIKRGYNAYNYSTARIAKGDFIRMKEISLTYDFPKKWIDPLRMDNLSLKVQVTNPFIIYSDKALGGQDPEYYQSGGVSSPLAKQFTFTLRIGF
ncbi:MAG: SusC/RagA family TonB-linked outer membrane protein [Rikenellaceae bacterium]|nr:SusC/RagA family TonB-linked outer membrane protein [Rikenellaceae bacterium]